MSEQTNPTDHTQPRIDLREVYERTPHDPSILVADGYGLRIHVERGHLVIHDGIGTHRRTRRLPRVERTITRLLILGHTGGITLDALAWCHDVGISVTQLDPITGRPLMAVGSVGRDDPRLRRAQALASNRPIGLTITQALISEKIKRQAHVLRRLGETRAADGLEHHACLEGVTALRTIAEIESQAANTYFAAWTRHVTATFATRDRTRIPDHWLSFDGRRSLLDYGRSPRKAAAPVNAILNYCYALAEAECRIALVAVGLDPGLGILHADKNGRDNLALDIIEPVRPRVDALVLDVLERRHFRAADFHQAPDGHCRILAPLTHELAESARDYRYDIGRIAEYVANSLAKDSAAPIRLSTPLTGTNHKLAAVKKVSGRRTRKQAPARSPAAKTCRDCGAKLTSSQSKFCGACWVPERERLARGLGARSAETRSRIVADTGQDPSQTSTARTRRIDSLKAERAARDAWDAEHAEEVFDREVFAREVTPRLKRVTLARIVEATGLSLSAASRVRAGTLDPHPRHWAALRGLSAGS